MSNVLFVFEIDHFVFLFLVPETDPNYRLVLESEGCWINDNHNLYSEEVQDFLNDVSNFCYQMSHDGEVIEDRREMRKYFLSSEKLTSLLISNIVRSGFML
ncbi:hypothetical protein HC928_04140 [bacterium]|nr:hypothetical protein [bacterium]